MRKNVYYYQGKASNPLEGNAVEIIAQYLQASGFAEALIFSTTLVYLGFHRK